MVRVLCTALNAESGPHFKLLTDAGHECLVPDRLLDLWNNEILTKVIRGFDAIIAGSEPYPVSVIAASPQLRVLACRVFLNALSVWWDSGASVRPPQRARLDWA